MSTKDSKSQEEEVLVNDEQEKDDFFEVQVPDILLGDETASKQDEGTNTNWYKVKGWYNELAFYSKVFQFFVEEIKETESKYGWWIIVISTVTSFVTMFTVDPFKLTEQDTVYYNWVKNLIISVMSVCTTLIAAWVKKKGYVKRIQAIDKRIGRLEKFIGILDYQFRLVPREKRQNYLEFITKMRDEHNELSIYSNLISPSEFTRTIYIITRFNAPLISGSWPWYNTTTKKPRPGFARNIIKAYESHYSYKAWCTSALCCTDDSIKNNPLLFVDKT
tara:strand:- start:895 stop:1722 length:828 start_codon:yes stop_codon:yes gene_type:complete